MSHVKRKGNVKYRDGVMHFSIATAESLMLFKFRFVLKRSKWHMVLSYTTRTETLKNAI